MTIAAAELGVIVSTSAQTAEKKLPATKPGTHTSVGPLKQIDAGLLAILRATREATFPRPLCNLLAMRPSPTINKWPIRASRR